MGEGLEDRLVWLSVPELAARLGVANKSVYWFIDRGRFPAYKMGRAIRIKESDLDVFLADALIQPGELVHSYED